MKVYKTLMCVLALSVLSSCSNVSTQQCVDALYERMTDAEREAQLRSIYLGQFFSEDGVLDTAKCAQMIPNGIGHFSQFAMDLGLGPNEMRDRVAAMQEWIMNNTPNGIPALFHEEALSGVNAKDATVYPQQIGLACSFNPELAAQKTRETGIALRRMGGRLALSPMVDVVKDLKFNRLEESYGQDAYLGAAMGVAFMKGLQDGGLHQSIAGCTKHFLGYGGGGNAEDKELYEEILLPHEAIIRLAGSKVLMTGYHSMRGEFCVANEWLQKTLVRDYLGFDGLLVSDYESITKLPLPGSYEKGVAAFNAGNDVDFPHGENYENLLAAVERGDVSRADFEASVKRVLTLKAELGLLDKNPYLYDKDEIEFDTPSERETAYKLATQSVVLLKNDILPLKGAQKIFLTGPNANSMWALCGDYSFQSMHLFWQSKIESPLHPRFVFLKDGMENRLPEGSILSYERGVDWTEIVETVIEEGGDPRTEYMRSIQNRKIDSGETADWNKALALASESDVIVAAMGENALLCGENRDRKTFRLPGRQEEFVRALLETGKPVVLVMFGGRAQLIGDLAEKCAAVIEAWYPGEEGGNALADILYGNVCPSGKLSVDYPDDENGIKWPFGYGLSYSSFEYSDFELPEEVSTLKDSFELSFKVKNTGSVEADEIAQLYLSPMDRSARLRPQSIQGFARVSLRPGESKKVRVVFHTEQMGYYNGEGWQTDPGRYILKVGASSRDIRLEKTMVLTGEPSRKSLRNYYLSETK